MVCRRHVCIGLVASLLAFSCLTLPSLQASAEWYVAGQAGVNFADPLRNIRGTGTLAGLDAPNFNLKTGPAFGGKLGVFPNHGVFGFELDLSYSNPHIKNLDDVPGIHLSVTTIGAHLLLRYPGVTWQPYIGGGPTLLVARLGRSLTTESDTQLSFGGNVLVGIRAFVTPKVALFTESNIPTRPFALAVPSARWVGSIVPIGRNNDSWESPIISRRAWLCFE